MKKYILLLLLVFGLFGIVGCQNNSEEPNGDKIIETESPCKDNPFGEGCYNPSKDLDHISTEIEEFLVEDDFEGERTDQKPRKWLIYSNPEYKAGAVDAKVLEEDGNKFVRLYSDGSAKPPYPQGAAQPTLIFTTKFNLDLTKKGQLEIDVMVPEEENNQVSFGLSAGAVNVINFTISKDYKLSSKVGGPYFYFSGNADAGQTHPTDIVITPGKWYKFLFTWDIEQDKVQSFIYLDDQKELVVDSAFHVSNHFNAKLDNEILGPNVISVTMPYSRLNVGYAFIDNVKVSRMED